MAQYHIVAIAEDALVLNRERVPELKAALGEAVHSLCDGPPLVNISGPKPINVQDRDVLNCVSAIRWAGDVHHTDHEVFVWSEARLKPLREVSREELERVSNAVARALQEKS